MPTSSIFKTFILTEEAIEILINILEEDEDMYIISPNVKYKKITTTEELREFMKKRGENNRTT